MQRSSWFLPVPFFCLSAFAAQTVVSFDALVPQPNQAVHDRSATDDAVTFVNQTYTDGVYAWWAGFAFSTVSNATAGTWTNQFAAAQAWTNAYAVGYADGYNPAPEILFDLPTAPKSVRVNTTAYAAHVIRNGSPFSRPFAAGDFFELTLTACDAAGTPRAATNHVLADFRAGRAFVQTNWTALDLTALGDEVAAICAAVFSTVAGAPTYFALADFTYAYAGIESGVFLTTPPILCWASGVAEYEPGPNVSNRLQAATNALGAAEPQDLGQNGGLHVASLGDNGRIALTFPAPIADGPGADFAVFENAFGEEFLELAFVEVSSDGTHFARFPCHTLATNPVEGYSGSGGTEADAYGGLAGKHLQGFGTPFDLRLLAGTPGLDVRRVTHVRIVDIPGDGSVTDPYGNAIFDPFPTFGSGGFDLDAIGALHVRIEISTDPHAPAPALPGFTPVLEYNPALEPAGWTSNAPARGTPGFFRWRFVRAP